MKTSNWENGCIQTLVILCLVFTFTGCAGNRLLTRPYSPGEIIHYSQLKSWDESRNLNNCVVYVNEGDSIPLKLSMETDFMEIEQDQVDLVAKQKLYFMIKMPEDLSEDELAKLNKLNSRSFSEMSKEQRAAFLKHYMLYISKDAVHWAPLYGGKAYRKVLGFKAGLLSFALLASPQKGLEGSLDIRTVKK